MTDGGFALPEQCAARLQELVEWVEGAEGPIWTSEGVDESLIRRLRGLSPQERRIVDQVRRGYTSRQIGLHLGLAEKTVRNYVSTVIGKLGLKSRRDIVALLADQGEASA